MGSSWERHAGKTMLTAMWRTPRAADQLRWGRLDPGLSGRPADQDRLPGQPRRAVRATGDVTL